MTNGIWQKIFVYSIHDTTSCQDGLTTGCIVYVYKHSTGCQTRLTTGCIVYTAGCKTGCRTRFDNRLNEQLFVQHGCQTGLTTGWMFVYTIQPVVKPVVQPVWQRAKSLVSKSKSKPCVRTAYSYTKRWVLFSQHHQHGQKSVSMSKILLPRNAQ